MPTYPVPTRRLFLKAALTGAGAAAVWLMDTLARRAGSIPESAQTTMTVPWSAADGIRFYDRAIVVNSAEGVAVFSSTCTHLRCRIQRAEGGELVCPCHGSRFSTRGEVVRGPAQRSLQPLAFTLDRQLRQLQITLEKQ